MPDTPIYIPDGVLANPLDADDVIRVDRSGRTMYTRVEEFASDPAFAGQFAPLAGSLAEGRRAIPTLTRSGPTPIITPDDSALPTLYWPSVLKVTDLIDNPIDDYYMWTSTDHATEPDDGVELWTAPHPLGPWTSSGEVFNDSGDTQTETPSVVWDEANSQFLMYYQTVGGGNGVQVTQLATSADGETWAEQGVVIDVNDEFMGDGHTGYFRPMRVGNRWVAYHLMGGAGFSHFAMSYSNDGLSWYTDPVVLGHAEDVAGVGNLLQWNHSSVVRWRGELIWIGIIAARSAGGGPSGSHVRYIGAAPISADFRHLLAPPTPVIESSESWESTDFRSCHTFVDEGKLYVFYKSNEDIGVAVAS